MTRPSTMLFVLGLAACDQRTAQVSAPVPTKALEAERAPSTPVAIGAQPTTRGPQARVFGGELGRAGRLQFRVAAPLVARAPSSAMRAAEYVIEGAAAAEQTSLVVYYFGREGSGTVSENVDRWLRQYLSLDGDAVVRSEESVREMTVGTLRVTVVDVSGTLNAAMPGGPGPTAPKPNQRLLGAIVEGPEGLVFFKLTGPIVGVESARRSFEAMVQSIAVESSAR